MRRLSVLLYQVVAMNIFPTLIALACYVGGLLTWRSLYPDPNTTALGLVALGALLLAGMVGGIRLSVQRRRAFLAMALEDKSWFRHVLSGRFTATVTNAVSGVVIGLALAYHLLVASAAEVYLAMSLGVSIACAFLVLNVISARHVRPLYRASLFAPFLILPTSSVFVAVHFLLARNVIPLPPYLDAPGGLAGVLAAAQAELPRHHQMVFEALAALRAVEATAYWLLAQADFAPAAPVALFLLQGALVHVSLAKLAVDLQAVCHALAGIAASGGPGP